MVEIKDLSLWEDIKAHTKPLVKRQVVKQFIRKYIQVNLTGPISYTLDLHGYTVQEAYNKLQDFVYNHYENESRYITVITGKGTPEKESFIHYEIKSWLETEVFKKYLKNYEWTNGNGALKIFLKKNKKRC